jgi:hypothetical protein
VALAALGLTWTTLSTLGLAEPPSPRRIEIDAQLDPAKRLLRGSCKFSFANDSAIELARLPIYLYPNLLAAPADDLVDVTFPHRFPGGFSAAGMELGVVLVDGVEVELTEEVNGAHSGLLVWATLPLPLSPGAKVVLEIEFRTLIPERFGPFGEIDGTVVLLGGWHPLVPRLDREGFALHAVDPMADIQITISGPSPGLLVIGDRITRLNSRTRAEVVLTQWSGPVLLYHRSAWHLSKGRDSTQRALVHVSSKSRSGPQRKARRVRDAVAMALADSPPTDPSSRPYLLLEAPLREMVAIPLRGGLLYSGLAFEVTPLESLESRHTEDLQSAVVASNLLSQSEMDLFEALLTINLVQFVRWGEGKADPVFLRRFLQQMELWGSLDKMGTDPQAHFQTSMFFTPELPAPLRRSPALFAREVPSPRSAARMVYNILGAGRVLTALSSALSTSSRLQPALEHVASLEEREMLGVALAPLHIDLELAGERETEDGFEVDVCKHGDVGPLPLELLIKEKRTSRLLLVPCRGSCCTIATGARTRPQVTLDPHGLLLQEGLHDNHPRRNDRNHLDLKWVLNRPFVSFAGGDRLPAMGVELQVEPRWDLQHRFVLRPSVTSNRGTISGLWRYGFGHKVRPTYLANSLSLGVRAAFPIDGSDGSLLGPVFSYLHYTRQSRMNPFKGNWSYLFAYPIFTPDFEEIGSRFGAMTSQLFGRSPDHVLAVRLNCDTGVGWIPKWDVPATGGLEGLRALSSFAASSRHRIGGSVEYRFMPIRNLHASVMRLGYITALQFAFFVDGAAISDDIESLFDSSSTLIDVGIGFRPHADVFGVLPGIISIDVAYLLPILGAAQGGTNVVLSFYQPF